MTYSDHLVQAIENGTCNIQQARVNFIAITGIEPSDAILKKWRRAANEKTGVVARLIEWLFG